MKLLHIPLFEFKYFKWRHQQTPKSSKSFLETMGQVGTTHRHTGHKTPRHRNFTSSKLDYVTNCQ